MLKDSIIELYQRYGFELGADNDQYLVFFSQGGYFQNAEIVVIDEKFDIANINKKEYEEVGYSVRVREYSDIDSIHDALFNGFFNTVITTKKVNQEYDVFCGQQKKKLVTNNYHYILSVLMYMFSRNQQKLQAKLIVGLRYLVFQQFDQQYY